MCIIAVVPEGLEIKESIVDTMWNRNSDGAGFMYAEEGKLVIQKGFMTLKDFKDAYHPHIGKKVVLHFRIKTHGETNAEMTHPFQVDDNLAFAHNGIISGFGSKSHSDTWHFNEEIIKELRQSVPNFLHLPVYNKLITQVIGHSKLVFMDNEGNVDIVNKNLGDESEDGFWFSNSTWKSYDSFQKKTNYQEGNKSNSGDGDTTGNSSVSTPTTTTKKYNSDIFRINDLVYLSRPYKNMKEHTLGIVTWFTGGYNIAVAMPSGTEYIPVSFLEKAMPIEMLHRVGHLEKGKKLIHLEEGVGKNSHMTRVLDTEKDQKYWVPYSSWITLKENDINYCDFVASETIIEADWYPGI